MAVSMIPICDIRVAIARDVFLLTQFEADRLNQPACTPIKSPMARVYGE